MKTESETVHQLRPTNENPHGSLRRLWPILLVLALALPIAMSETLFSIAGTLIYVPVLSIGAFLIAAFLRRFFNRTTTESDARDGTFDANWDALDPKTKCILHVVQFLVYFLVVGLIAAAVMGK